MNFFCTRKSCPSPPLKHIPKNTTPVQTAATDAPASSSTKNVASSTKSKKKSSPLDAIRNDPDALYALLSKMVKDDETPNSDATNSDDEKTSQASVSKDPYYQIYPYPQDWFAHDEEHPEDQKLIVDWPAQKAKIPDSRNYALKD